MSGTGDTDDRARTSGGMRQLKLMDDLRSPILTGGAPPAAATRANDGSKDGRTGTARDVLRDGGASLRKALRPSVTVAREGMPITCVVGERVGAPG